MGKQKAWRLTENRARRVNFRAERKTYLIITEGHTERAYLCHFKTTTALEIRVEKPTITRQLGLVEKAISTREGLKKDSTFTDDDEVWIVCDRDENRADIKDKDNFARALALAKKNNINIALSNDSFDLWYLLHFQEVSNSLTREQIVKKLSKYLGRKYKSSDNKTLVEDLYYELIDKRAKAIERAKRIYENHKKSIKHDEHIENKNPVTTVFLLIEKIMKEDGFKEE